MKLVPAEESINLLPTPQQIAQEQAELDQLGPYVFHADKGPDEKLQKALGIEDSLRISFGMGPFNRACELATQALLPVFRQKYAPKGSATTEFMMDGDDRLLRSNVILTLLRLGAR